MEKIEYTKYFILLIMLVILYISFLLIQPFIGTLVISTILAYAFFPLHRLLERKIKRRNLSALITTALIILFIVVTILFTVNAVTKEVSVVFITAKQWLATGNLFGVDCETADTLLCSTSDRIQEFTKDPQVRLYIDDTLRSGTTVITKKLSDFVFSLPRRLIDVFIMFFTLFYLFRDGRKIVHKLESLLPFKKQYGQRIMYRLNETMYAVVYVYLLVAVVQGILGGLGFFLFGLANPILWGGVMILFSLLPIGSIVVWLPAALYLILTGVVQSTNSLIVKGVLLIVYGVIIVGLSDNVIRLKVIGGKAHIHPVLIVLGVVGGLILFGFIGTIIGPLVLALLMALIEMYEQER